MATGPLCPPSPHCNGHDGRFQSNLARKSHGDDAQPFPEDKGEVHGSLPLFCADQRGGLLV